MFGPNKHQMEAETSEIFGRVSLVKRSRVLDQAHAAKDFGRLCLRSSLEIVSLSRVLRIARVWAAISDWLVLWTTCDRSCGGPYKWAWPIMGTKIVFAAKFSLADLTRSHGYATVSHAGGREFESASGGAEWLTDVGTLAWHNRGTVFFLLVAFCFHTVGGTREVTVQLSGGNPRFPETGIKVRNARNHNPPAAPTSTLPACPHTSPCCVYTHHERHSNQAGRAADAGRAPGECE